MFYSKQGSSSWNGSTKLYVDFMYALEMFDYPASRPLRSKSLSPLPKVFTDHHYLP